MLCIEQSLYCVFCFCRNKNLAVHVRVVSDAYVCCSTILFNYFFSVTYYILCVDITCSVVYCIIFLLFNLVSFPVHYSSI
jgi:hypothetical protein